MRQQRTYLVVVEQRGRIRVVDGSLHFLALDVGAQGLAELYVHGMSGACGYNASFQRTADERYVAHEIEQFVAGGFIGAGERLGVYETEFGDIARGHVHHVGYAVHLGLLHGRIVDYDGVVEVAAFDKSCGNQRLYFTHKHEGACRSDFRREVGHGVHCGVLVAQHRRIEIDFNVDAELVVGQKHELGTGGGIHHFHFVFHIVEVLVGILLNRTAFENFFHERSRAAVENGNFRTIYLDEAVVDARSVEGGHCMFDCADSGCALAHYCAAHGGYDILGQSVDYGFALDVDTLELISVIFRSRAESGLQACSGVQAFALHAEALV